ncbi:hypothetical protein K488DRAFT_48677 [Vararia minispora EC-137]|uniref:Uncharacterized protein n=1 Tax=Vararia minispora EC-137 TaxID=1314806 RepID=A0ACB8QMA3_9AGAM|nr:hypothetical protein K488DRAFT_48677 [Vararia minispora EC-137]
MARSRRWGPIRALLVLSPILLGLPYLTYNLHYELPEPVTDLVDPHTNLPQLSEAQILEYARILSEDIGYRTVGTAEHAAADAWLHGVAQRMGDECAQIAQSSGRKLECEVWRQEGSGSHRFDMMGKRLYKTYVGLSNIILRVSDGTDTGKAHAVLVNAHLDSTLPSPGAADDALAVGVMLECIRVLVRTPGWEPKHAIVFLFNNAEESLQDGSQLFSTQHPVRSTVRAFVNLEAAGTVGPELLFQATSEEMIMAYSKVPYPFGTVVANEIFSSGVLLSDTDFRQFELYLNITGLDMAIVGNSYMYHTRKDLVKHIQPGAAQHMAENTLAILKYLSSDESPLPQLTSGYHKPSTIFFSYVSRAFFLYSHNTAIVMYATLAQLSVTFVIWTYKDPAPAIRKRGLVPRVWWAQLRAIVSLCAGFLGAIVAANAHAAVMHRLMGKNMSWFAMELSPLILYGPSALAGALASQLLLDTVHERTMFTALLLLLTVGACGLQLVGIGSAAMLFVSGLPLFCALLLDRLVSTSPIGVSLLAYALGQIVPILTGTQIICSVFDVFVPLTGRIGADAPAEHIIATIATVTLAYTFPLVLPFAHRYGAGAMFKAVIGLNMLLYAMTILFAQRSPFDTLHQRRVFVLSIDNVTSHERHLHIGAADGAPGFDALVEDIAAHFGVAGVGAAPEDMNDYNGDWDVLYPFSAFMSPYKVPLPVETGFVSPHAGGQEKAFVVRAKNDVVDAKAGTRSLTLEIVHPDIIWTVIAFDAHVLKWSLDDAPPDEYTRHHIKEASFHGTDVWTVDLILHQPISTPLRINFIGVREQGMWPGKSANGAEARVDVMRLFGTMDRWLDVHTGGTVDAMMLGCVGGIIDV